MVSNLEIKLEAQRSSSVINLDDCCIGDEGCQVLSNFLNKYTTVADLELKGNNIGGAGISALAQVLRSNYHLRSINLAWNNLGTSESGLQNLFNALGENRNLQKIDLNNNEIGPEVCNSIANCLKSNQSLHTLDLRWNRIGNSGAKAIIKGLQMNKSLQILELAGNKVSDDYLRQINDILNRNKTGGPYTFNNNENQRPNSFNDFSKNINANTQAQSLGSQFAYERVNIPNTQSHLISPSKKQQLSQAIEDEKLLINQRRVDLVKVLELETKKRQECEENFEKLREEFLKSELAESRIKSEMQARIDQLESEKQNLQLKLVRQTETFEKGDGHSKERQYYYEEMLGQSQRAYVQLEEQYKGMVEKLQQERSVLLKNNEKTFQTKIKSLEDQVRDLGELCDEQRIQIDQLEASKIDQKLDYDNQLYQLEKKYQHDRNKAEDIKLKHLESVIEKLTKEREDLNSQLKQDSKQMQEQFRVLSQQLERTQEKKMKEATLLKELEKENQIKKGQVDQLTKQNDELEKSLQKARTSREEILELVNQGQTTKDGQLKKLRDQIVDQQNSHKQLIEKLNKKILQLDSENRSLEEQANHVNKNNSSLKESIKVQMLQKMMETFEGIQKV
eukprot:403354723